MTLPVLFLVPARSGSRRLPGKNLRTVAGIPLVGRAAMLARMAASLVPGGPHAVVCSTDDPTIGHVARAWSAEVPFLRPASLADDAAGSVDVALHALDRLADAGREYRALVLVQPTSPLTSPDDVVAAVRLSDETGQGSVATVSPIHAAVDATGEALPGTTRLNGAVYVVAPAELRDGGRFVTPGRTRLLPMPAERSVDVDELADLEVAEAIARAAPVDAVTIGARRIGDGPCFVIAEAGVNHDGDAGRAHLLVDAAADAGADAVKFQVFDPAAVAGADAPLADYQRSGAPTAGGSADGQLAMLERLALPARAWPGLREHAEERGLVFLATPFDPASADLLVDLGVTAIKVASGELTNLPFLARLASAGLPLLVSTGMAEMHEIAAAIATIRARGAPVCLFHCVSAYPAPAEEANLRAIPTLRSAFRVPVGWSDHTPGDEAPLAAVALGASLVEKHLTIDRSLPGPDHRASLEPSELTAMVDSIRTVESMLGSGQKQPTPSEMPIAAVARRSMHWAVDMAAGAPVGAEDIVMLRPGTGLAPGRLGEVVGRTTARATRAGTIVEAADVEGLA
jgi:N-acetylneuraminate synthase/N,N'-diacetyllegionaminate synthase